MEALMSNFWQTQFITPSRIDMFQSYMTEPYEWQFGDSCGEEWSKELFIRKLLRLTDEHIKASSGKALHKALELCGNEQIEECTVNGWKIIFNIDQEIYLPKIRECAVSGEIAGLTISGTVDAIDERLIRDYKTTTSFNWDSYYFSWQWKVYLLLANRKEFVYDVFTRKLDEKNKELISKTMFITDYNKIELFQYKNMKKDVEDIITWYFAVLTALTDDFVRIAIENNIKIKGLIE